MYVAGLQVGQRVRYLDDGDLGTVYLVGTRRGQPEVRILWDNGVKTILLTLRDYYAVETV